MEAFSGSNLLEPPRQMGWVVRQRAAITSTRRTQEVSSRLDFCPTLVTIDSRCASGEHPRRPARRLPGPKAACSRGVTIRVRIPPFYADVDRLPESIELPCEPAAALQTDRPTLASWLNRALSVEEAAITRINHFTRLPVDPKL
jgi:hypothetical protein